MNALQILLTRLLNSPRFANNPMAQNVIAMINNGNMAGVEEFGRNIARERGVDFDSAFADFKKNFYK